MFALLGILAIIFLLLIFIGLPLFVMGVACIFMSLYEIFVEKEKDIDMLLTSTYITLWSSLALGLAIFISFCVENM